ncbi:ead/Ea22-like family protein [Pseudomonas aeruginosa]|uniref:ead/Ea22-like family protein n=1 Tax=Pseudomonas aeruginosa TaxID=287 RepID=UPI00071AFEDA|nr:ead/Ea22-like family protein [Pseudomonas aeruginosa]
MDTNKLKELAERATPGPWSAAWEEGDDTAWSNLFPVIQAGNGEVVIGNEGFYTDLEQDKANATFCAAANPQAILGLIDEVERLEAELSQCASALPGTYYMDPPDGGNVSIPEQIRRMAKDAARYRWLIASAWYVGPEPKGDTEAVSWHDHNDTMHGVTTAIDAAIEGAKQ